MPSLNQSAIRTNDKHIYRKPNGIYHYRFNIKDNGSYRSLRLSMYSRCPYEAGALAGLITYRTWISKIMESGLPYSEVRQRLISLFRDILAEHKEGIDKEGLLTEPQKEAYRNTASFGADPTIQPELTHQIAERIGLTSPTDQERKYINQDKPALLQGLTDAVLAYNQSLQQPYTDTTATSTISETVPTTPMKRVSEVFEEFSIDKRAANKLTEKTLAYYRGGLKRFIDAVGDLPINEVDKLIMRQFRDTLTGSDSNKNKRLMGMSSIFTWAIDNDYNINNPFTSSKITIAGHEQGKRDAFNIQEVQQIFKHVENPENTRFKDHHKLICKILAYSGARLNEIAQLYCDDIQEKDGIWFITINDDKPDKSIKNTNAKRVVPLHHAIAAQVIARKRELATGRLFPELTNPKPSYGARYSAWFTTNVKKRLKLRETTTLHSFRHTVATQLQQADIAETVTAQLLGHSRGEALSYTHYGKGADLIKLKSAIDLIGFD